MDTKGSHRQYNSSIRCLEDGQGFSFNYLSPKQDRLARRAAEEIFGLEKVSKVLSTLHRSQLTYENLMEDFSKYDRAHASNDVRADPIYRMTLASIMKDFKKITPVIPYDMEIIHTLPDFARHKSPGLPYKLMNLKTKMNVIEKGYLPQISEKWLKVGTGMPQEFPDVCLFGSAQIAKVGENKVCTIFGYSIEVYMEEGRFFYPLQELMKNHSLHDFNIAYGFEMANGGMVALNDLLVKCPNATYICIDWLEFDKTIPPWLIHDAFSILEQLIDFSHVRTLDEIRKVDQVDQRRRWKYMINYFINTPVQTSKGERYLVMGGVPNGSCFANILNSIINVLVMRYCLYLTTGHYPMGEIFFGDNGVFVHASYLINLYDIAYLAKTKFGMELNMQNSYFTNHPGAVQFLGYINLNGAPFIEHDMPIVHFILPEFTRGRAIDAASAALGQLYTTFNPVAAKKWYSIIVSCCKTSNLHLQDVIDNLKLYFYRHLYLSQIGIQLENITVPQPDEYGFVYEAMSSNVCNFNLKLKHWNYQELWEWPFVVN